MRESMVRTEHCSMPWRIRAKSVACLHELQNVYVLLGATRQTPVFFAISLVELQMFRVLPVHRPWGSGLG